MNNNKRRYYQIAGITLQVEADLPITDTTFHPKFRAFEVENPGEDIITIRHHFKLPQLDTLNLGRELYRKPPWLIYQNEDKWVYLNIPANRDGLTPDMVAIINRNYSECEIYSNGIDVFDEGDFRSLTLFPTDQILLGRVLADRRACFMHSSGVVLQGQGLLFLGHSEAGKSTMVKMLHERAEILCDDRIVVRRWPDIFRIHGCWSHGEVAAVSGAHAPLSAVLFLNKSDRNCINRVSAAEQILGRLLACLIKPLGTADWWDKALEVIGTLVREIPCYEIEFDRSGKIVQVLEQLSESR